MQVQVLNRFYYTFKNFFFNTRDFFYQIVCLGVGILLFFSFPYKVLAGNVHPPVSPLNDNAQYNAYANSFNEFSVNGNKIDNQNLNLSSGMLGMSGPLSFNLTWSDQYSFIFNVNYLGLINEKNAYGIEADVGIKSNRINLTLGHAFSSKNRIKFTVERLAQKQSFDFDSGSMDHWVSQYAGGAEFQHILGQGVLNNVAVGGYYARALNHTLDPIIYNEAGVPWINYRHIAGASSRGLHTSFGIRPWKTGMVTLTGYYDCVNYDNQYANVSASNSSELGFGIELNQYISPSMQGNFSYVYRATYETIQAGIEWIHNIFHQTHSLAWSVTGSHSSSDNVPHDNSLTIGMQYYFKPIANIYRIPEFHWTSLKNWTSQPAVRMDQVLVAADQATAQVMISWHGAKMLTFSTVRSKGVIDEHIHREDAMINIANGNLEYFLTVNEIASPVRNTTLFKQDDLKKEQPMTGHDLTQHNIKTGVKYQVILRVHDKTTGAFREYEDYFQVNSGSIIWPEVFNPKFIYIDRDDDLNVHGRVSAIPPISTVSDKVILTASIREHDTGKSVYEGQPSSEDVRNGIDVHELRPSVKYDFSIDPTDEYGTKGQAKTATFVVKPVNGKMQWTVHNIIFTAINPHDMTQGGRIQWSAAVPSHLHDTVKYTVTINLGAQKITQTTQQNFLDITKGQLQPNTTYAVTLSAHDAADADVTLNNLTFTTGANAQMIGEIHAVKFNWMDASDPSKGGTFSWKGPQPSQKSDQIHYSLIVKQGKNTVKCSSIDTTTCTINNSHLSLLPNTLFTSLSIEATDEHDLPVAYHDTGFSTPQGVMTGEIKDVLFTANTANEPNLGGRLTWNGPTPSIKNASMTSTCVVSQGGNHFMILGDGASCIISKDKHLLSNTAYMVSITEKNIYDQSKTASNLSFTTPKGKLKWNRLTKSNTSIDDQTVSFLGATPSNLGKAVTYLITVTGEDGTSIKKSITTVSAHPSYKFTQPFLPNVDYTVAIKATDEDDISAITQSIKVGYTLVWNNQTQATWHRIRNYKPNNPKASYDRYTFNVTPQASTNRSLGLIRYQYQIKYITSKGTTIKVPWTALNTGKNTISNQDVPYGANVTLQVKAYLADVKYVNFPTSIKPFYQTN